MVVSEILNSSTGIWEGPLLHVHFHKLLRQMVTASCGCATRVCARLRVVGGLTTAGWQSWAGGRVRLIRPPHRTWAPQLTVQRRAVGYFQWDSILLVSACPQLHIQQHCHAYELGMCLSLQGPSLGSVCGRFQGGPFCQSPNSVH